VAFGDYDRDGALDALVMDLEGEARLLHNERGSRPGSWLVFNLKGGPRNREGIGARITLEAAGRRQIREVSRGRSVLSSCDAQAHFGLGSAKSVERVAVRWPDGLTEEWPVNKVNAAVTLQRGSGRKLAARPEHQSPR
jgi:hypothetical protein